MRFFRKPKKKDGWLTLAIQGDGIAAVSVKRVPGAKPSVRFAHFFPGKVDPELLEKAAREVQAASYRCTTLLGPGEYQLLNVEAPNVPAQEMKTAVRWRLKDMLDFPVDQATIDVIDMPLDQSALGRVQRTMFAVAARNAIVGARQKLFTEAKVDLSVIDIPEMAQRNISAMLEPEGRGVAMLCFGSDGGLLTVSYRGELFLSRRLDVTLEQLVETEHERKLHSFDKITLELQRSIDHFERQFSFISVSRLVLGPSAIAGLDEYLSSNLYMPIDTLDLATVLDLGRVPSLADKQLQQRFLLALGAALRDEEGTR